MVYRPPIVVFCHQAPSSLSVVVRAAWFCQRRSAEHDGTARVFSIGYRMPATGGIASRPLGRGR